MLHQGADEMSRAFLRTPVCGFLEEVLEEVLGGKENKKICVKYK